MNKLKFAIFMFLFRKEINRYHSDVGRVRRLRTGSEGRDVIVWDLENGYYVAKDIEDDIDKKKEKVQRKLDKEKAKLEKLNKKKVSK